MQRAGGVFVMTGIIVMLGAAGTGVIVVFRVVVVIYLNGVVGMGPRPNLNGRIRSASRVVRVCQQPALD